jgi:16S rRNA (uracil1498-N3)-methyltransferase
MRANFRLQRLFIEHKMQDAAKIELPREQANYLLNVLRLKDDDELLVFNGQDGEYLAVLKPEGRKKAFLVLKEQARPQTSIPELMVMFAPLKVGRLDYLVQKMVEMGAGCIQPVFTDHTQLHKVNEKRLSANILEAAEQCGVLSIPELMAPAKLSNILKTWDETRQIIFCDEGHQTNNPLAELQGLKQRKLASKTFALLIGPEGGFSQSERDLLHSLDFVTSIPLGPRILRADTAAVAAMAVVQTVLGDWE